MDNAKGKEILSFRDVYFSYNSGVVLENVNLVIYEGDLISIVGPNGGGKTTFLKLILGLLKPVRGEVTVLGNAPENICRQIGYVPQSILFDPQFPVTVMDIVLMGRLGGAGLSGLFGWRKRSDYQAAVYALEQVEMNAYQNRPFTQLSGGQRQRVLIARALATQPAILLLDEPTANIDAPGEVKLLEVIRKISAGMTILMVSHDLSFVADMVKRVICINRRVHVHPTAEITDEMIRGVYGTDVRLVRHDLQFNGERAGHD
jgi:zinc transport system ATP-binding protein